MADSAGGLSSVNGAAGSPGAIPPTSGNVSPSQDTSEVHPPNQQSAAADEDPEWDFGNGKRFKRSEALKKIQALEKGMHEGFRGRSEAQKRYDALSQALSSTGISVEQFLQDPGAHFSQAAQDHIARQMDEALMDPRERDLTQRERDIAEREAKHKEWQEQQQAQEREQRTSARIEQITQQMAPAMEAAGLPRNVKTVARMADAMRAALKQKIRLEPAEAAAYVREQITQEQQWHLSQLKDPESFAAALGPEGLELARQALLARNKKANPQPQKSQARQPARDTASGRYLGWAEYAKTKRI